MARGRGFLLSALLLFLTYNRLYLWCRPKDKLVQLVSQAIHESPRRMLRVNHIYTALELRYPFYAFMDKKQSSSWKSSVRHALFQKWFVKLRPSTVINGRHHRTRGSFWSLNYGSNPHDWTMPTLFPAGPPAAGDDSDDVKPAFKNTTRDTAVGSSPPESVAGSPPPLKHRNLPAVMPAQPRRWSKSTAVVPSCSSVTTWPAQAPPTPSGSAHGMESELNWVPWPFEHQQTVVDSSGPRSSRMQSTDPPSQSAPDVVPAGFQSEPSDYSHSTDPDADLWSSAGSVAEAISLLGLDAPMTHDHLFFPWLHSGLGTSSQTFDQMSWGPSGLPSSTASVLPTSCQNAEPPATSSSSLWSGMEPTFSTAQMTGLDLTEDPLAPTPLLCSAQLSDSGGQTAEASSSGQQGSYLPPATTLIGMGTEQSQSHNSDVALLWGFVTSLQCQQREDRYPTNQWTTHGSVAANLEAMAALAYPNTTWQ